MYLDVKVVGLENELYHTAGYEQRYFRSPDEAHFMVQYEISGVVLTLESFSRHRPVPGMLQKSSGRRGDSYKSRFTLPTVLPDTSLRQVNNTSWELL